MHVGKTRLIPVWKAWNACIRHQITLDGGCTSSGAQVVVAAEIEIWNHICITVRSVRILRI